MRSASLVLFIFLVFAPESGAIDVTPKAATLVTAAAGITGGLAVAGALSNTVLSFKLWEEAIVANNTNSQFALTQAAGFQFGSMLAQIGSGLLAGGTLVLAIRKLRDVGAVALAVLSVGSLLPTFAPIADGLSARAMNLVRGVDKDQRDRVATLQIVSYAEAGVAAAEALTYIGVVGFMWYKFKHPIASSATLSLVEPSEHSVSATDL